MSRETVSERKTAPDRKAVLHCGNCGHDSHVQGDWILHERRGSRSVWYQCPDCVHAVSVRPIDSLEGSRFPAPLSPNTSPTAFDGSTPPNGSALLEEFWRNYRDITTAWLSPWREDEAGAD